MLKLLVILAASAAVAAAPAAAASDDGQALIGRVLPTAEQHWQPWVAQWCPNGETVTIARAGSLFDGGTSAWAKALIGDPACRITIDHDLLASPRRLCVVLAHEIGHLLGHTHSRTGLMRSRPWMRDPLCRAFPRGHK